jgi:hypothetical protein
MLADPEYFEAHLIGKLDLLHEIAQPLHRIEQLARGRIGGVFNERVDANFHMHLTSSRGGMPVRRTACQTSFMREFAHLQCSWAKHCCWCIGISAR